MKIEIRNASFVNKGGELMLHAIMQMVSSRIEEAKFVIIPGLNSAPYEKFAPLGVLQKASFYSHRIQWGWLASLIPEDLRKSYGIVLDQEIDVVLDASGFAYGDQWGDSSLYELSQSCKRWSRRNTSIILMPQAFGPFNSSGAKKAIRRIVKLADLVFARDSDSYHYIVSIAGERNNICIAPDFTTLVDGQVPDSLSPHENAVCIIPNSKMIEKTSTDIRSSYIPFLIQAVHYLRKKKMNPFLLIHGGNKDYMLSKQISVASSNIPIIIEEDPIKIKGIIGTCAGTIGGRFHGLVNSLSQGVPALATGWSHKYQRLFEDFNFEDGLLNLPVDFNEFTAKADFITDKEKNDRLKVKLLERTEILKEYSFDMWDKIFNVIVKSR